MTTGRAIKILDKIASKFGSKGEIRRKNRIWLDVGRENLVALCQWLKNQRFEHLSAISVTDWLTDGKFEVSYHLWSYRDKVAVTLKVKVNRENPVIDSVTSIWGESAQIHEREMHELFGVSFEGNANLTPLFLEDWQGPPPFRKDFDWREYVREKYYDKANERERVYYG